MKCLYGATGPVWLPGINCKQRIDQVVVPTTYVATRLAQESQVEKMRDITINKLHMRVEAGNTNRINPSPSRIYYPKLRWGQQLLQQQHLQRE